MREKKRDTRIDILRFLAIIGIIVAHTHPPDWLFELRNFDVTLIVMMMGASFFISNQSKDKVEYVAYATKRFKRLIVPTWVFLTIFFTLFLVLSFVQNDSYYFDLNKVVNSYATLGGIGYVWIMRVFFIIALASPILLSISNKTQKTFAYFAWIIGAYVIYSMCILINNFLPNGLISSLYEEVFLYGFGYVLVAAIGIRLLVMKNKELLYLGVTSLLIYGILAISTDFASTQDFKYTPTMYYLSYGIFIGVCLYLLVSIPVVNKWLSNKFFMFISINSLWLYLWHIIPVYILKVYDKVSIFKSTFLLEFCFVFGIGLLLTLIHNKLSIIIKKDKSNKQLVVRTSA
ncbi:acyltransferase family protein [Sutcliffiella horikoshii]|uniref:acyltransferase family protein n=1 Tax=Sutcliffiella horikoshii TaxID=79883 RepID=UPI003CE7F75F